MKTPKRRSTIRPVFVGTAITMAVLLHGRGDQCGLFPCCTQSDYPLVDHEVEFGGDDGRVFYLHQKYSGTNRTDVLEGISDVELPPGKHWIQVRLATGTGALNMDFWSPSFCPTTRVLDAQLRVAILTDLPVTRQADGGGVNRTSTTLTNGLHGFQAQCQQWLPDRLARGSDTNDSFTISSRSASGFGGAPSSIATATGFVDVQPQAIGVEQNVMVAASPRAVDTLFCWGNTVAGDAEAGLTRLAFNLAAPTRCRILTSISRSVLDLDKSPFPFEISALNGPTAVRRDPVTGTPVAFEFHTPGWVLPSVKAYGYRFVATGGSPFLRGILPSGFGGPLTIKVDGKEFARLSPGAAFDFNSIHGASEFSVDGFLGNPASGVPAIPAFYVDLQWPPDDPAFEIQPRIVPEPLILPPSPEALRPGADLVLQAATFPSTSASYQWAFNGTNLVGATNLSLSLKHLGAADSGTYTITASNNIGSVLSPPMVLTVAGERLRFSRGPGGSVLSWDAVSATLESAPTSVGPWRSVTDASSPWKLQPGGESAYFRLRF